MQQINNLPVNSLPAWMVLFAFIASAILTFLKITEYVIKILKRPALDVRLTQETFFRCALGGGFDGEAIFANAVLLARNGAVLIKNVTFHLIKTSGSKKDFPLLIHHYGEKVKGTGNFADHNFYTTSPLAYIPKDEPQRIVYMAVIEEYAERIRKAVENAILTVEKYKTELEEAVKATTGDAMNELRADMYQRIEAHSNDFANNIMHLIQLEPGKYKLIIEINYQKTDAILKYNKVSKSEISFEVSESFKELYKTQLQKLASVTFYNTIFKRNDPIIFPEYKPYQINEI